VLDSRHRCLYLHGQHDTEQTLRDYLFQEHGAGTEWGVELTAVENGPDCVNARLRHADGREEAIAAQYLVACDGKNSRVRRQLQLLQDESDYHGSMMQNLDVFLRGFPDSGEYVHYCMGQGHFLMLAKLPGGYHRLLMSDRGESLAGASTPQESFQRIIDQHYDGVSMGEVLWHSRWESWVRLAHTYRQGRVFLAGDSAHVHSTTGGQGMNCCMQDAWNLGWKLALVLKGQARPALLDSYEAERKPIAEQVIWAASSMHDVFMGHGKSIAERTTRIADSEFLRKVVGHCSGVDYTYRNRTAADAGRLEGLATGDRLPDLDLPGGRTVHALLRHPDFTLLCVPPTGSHGIACETGLTAGLPLRVAQLPESAAVRQRYLCGPAGHLLLVRPDGYLAGGWTGTDYAAVTGCLERLLSS
jgi:2-polyprenyl-6-methoxyphenol hydroxylase-like FAD-dependent oxidoreductase